MHATHAVGWVRRLAREGGAVRAALEDALREDWAQTLCWLGPAGDGDPLAADPLAADPLAADPLAAAGVLDAAPQTLRARFLAAIGPTSEAAGLRLPLRRAKQGWELTEPLPWERWDAATYRLVPVAATA